MATKALHGVYISLNLTTLQGRNMFLSLLKPFALLSTIALSTLGVLSRKSRRARYAYHLTLYAGTLGFMSVAGVFISLVATVVGQVSLDSD